MTGLFTRLLRHLLPTETRIVRAPRSEPDALAHTMSVERVHAILRSAEGGDMSDFFSLARDIVASHGHTQAELGKRKLAAIGPPPVYSPADRDNPADVAVAEQLGEHFEELNEWFDVLGHLEDSTIYPVSVVEKIYQPSSRPGWRFEIRQLKPVPYYLLDWTTGSLRIRDTADDGTVLGTTHELSPIRYIVHRGHLLSSVPDTWGGPMRAIMFWWLFAVMGRDWWGRFLDRYGAPFIIAKYDQSDDASRVTLNSALSAASRLFGLVISNNTDVELEQANTSSAGDAFEKFHSVANREISKIIVGQTLSAEGQNLGLGGGQAAIQGDVREDFRQFDVRRLGHTIRTQLFKPLVYLNAWDGAPPRIHWGAPIDDDAAQVSGELIAQLAQAGIEVDDEGLTTLAERIGLSLRRKATPTLPSLAALAARSPDPGHSSARARRASDRIATAAAPDLAAAFRGRYAPVAEIIRLSTSAEDLERRLRQHYADTPPARLTPLIEEALVAHAANAALSFPIPPTDP